MITVKTTTDNFHDLWEIVNKSQGENVYRIPRDLIINLLVDHSTFSAANRRDVTIE
jgi:hypothetical protein